MTLACFGRLSSRLSLVVGRVQVNALPTLAQIQALLQPPAVPAVVGAASAILQSILSARGRNAHDRRGEGYTAVPCADGLLPVHWPAGFDRAALVDGPIAAVDSLLSDYGLQHGAAAGAVLVRRTLLAQHIGTMRP